MPTTHSVRREQDEWSEMLEDLFEDRERFRDEISFQLRLKINKHLNGTKREATDFVKAKFNEVDAYARKTAANDKNISNTEK